jgi:hypothetical protein
LNKKFYVWRYREPDMWSSFLENVHGPRLSFTCISNTLWSSAFAYLVHLFIWKWSVLLFIWYSCTSSTGSGTVVYMVQLHIWCRILYSYVSVIGSGTVVYLVQDLVQNLVQLCIWYRIWYSCVSGTRSGTVVYLV